MDQSLFCHGATRRVLHKAHYNECQFCYSGVIPMPNIITYVYIKADLKSRLLIDLCFRTSVVKGTKLFEYHQLN